MKKIFFLLFIGFFGISCSSDSDNNTDDNQETCNNPTAFQETEIGRNIVTVSWSQQGASSFTIEYGPQGFSLGSGTQLAATNTQQQITNLSANTTYDYYIRANCSSDNRSEFNGPESFTTLSCEPVEYIDSSNITETSADIEWFSEFEESFEVEYGLKGFSVGSGTKIPVNNQLFIQLNGLQPATDYDAYVRIKCGDDFSIYSEVEEFTTAELCNKPENFSLVYTTATTIVVDWTTSGKTAWEIEYGLVGFQLGTGTVIPTSESSYEITGLNPSTTYEIYVRANCGSDGFSENVGPLVATTN